MKSIVCISASVRAACQHVSACSPLSRGLVLCSSVGSRPTNVDFTSKTVIAQQPCVNHVRCFQKTHSTAVQMVSAAPLQTPVPLPRKREDELVMYHAGRRMTPKTTTRAPTPLSPYTPYVKPQSEALVNAQSLFEEGVIPELCSRLAGLPSNDRAEGLATLLGTCVEFGLDARSPPVLRLMNECLQLLSNRDIGVAQLCHLGKVACALEGRQSPMVAEVLNSIGAAVKEDMLSPSEAATVYSLLTLLHEPASQQQALMVAALHRHTLKLVHWLKASQVSDILQSLLRLQQRQTIPLVLRLSRRASHVFKHFTDDEVIKVLTALMILGQHDQELLAAMEKHLPARLGKCDPELISTVMEYCLQKRCRSELLFEAVAENFICNAERHSTPQVAKQIIAMGRLNYLPQCSAQMFKKLESILSTRFSQFQPRLLIDVLHACIHLERFPLNYMYKVFSTYFLQRLEAPGRTLDKNTLGQLTQLHLSTSLECTHYKGGKLPVSLHVKKFSSVDQAFETHTDQLLYKRVKGPLVKLLGVNFYSTKMIHSGYSIDVEIRLDEKGLALPLSQWDYTHTRYRIALCLDGQNHFCRNSQHLLGKEVVKRRHLRKMGFEVVQIPYFEFERQRTFKEQVQYLQDKIFPTISKFGDCSETPNKLGTS